MESDKWVVCCNEGQVSMCDLKNNGAVSRRPIQADAAMMNPSVSVLAVRSGQQLQIFNLELKAKMNSFSMGESVVFWRWIDKKTLAIITTSCVYHWACVEVDSKPFKGE